MNASETALGIGPRRIGAGNPPFVIAEVGQAHDGSLGLAHSFIDAAAAAGADAVKFQTHIAAAESTLAEPWRTPFSRQDATRYDYWKRMEFPPAAWRGLREHAAERDLVFLSSPFSFEAMELLIAVGVPAWKVASGEVNNLPLLRRMAATGLPILLSSGLSDWTELDTAVTECTDAGAPFAVFQCTTSYPTPPDRIGLNVLAELRHRYHCPVGLSDHSGKIYAGLAAAAFGAELIEVHVTFSRAMFGPDARASLTFAELAQLVEGAREIHAMRGSRVEKACRSEEIDALRAAFNKSVVAARDLDEGTVLDESHVALKKPGTGIAAAQLERVLGRRLKQRLAKDEQFQEHHLE